MKGKKKNRSIFIAILSFLSVASSTIVIARDFRLAVLPDKGVNFRCSTCHIDPNGGGPRNPFGSDYERIGIPAGDRYTDALAKLDSDGDGWTNEQEFSAKPVTRPGDPNSHPTPPKSVVSKGKKFTFWGSIKRIKD